ncbi:branched-chain amino acid ABC transporter substrate-binding protein [Deinococcus sp. KNUC1210]|uniref:branched-chain amino acid ABC transporter substrate-binding protein n=1 Tax=Deinococcus sp. KNUC1210 TaxID=2917691 RepID=UPI001EEF7D11|nr:branched-chain amino acid ABC transporter substrate-binding protein [Deinococcus sp. KNUC1210]ULH15065.1 branched-chain amino acid ABC transporter substrate-binding protein [Deinococcus sp. KNUC1210]
MKKLGLSVLTLGALSLGSAHAVTVIKIASMSPLSGPKSDQGLQIRNSTELAIKESRSQFLALGFDVQLVTYDDQGDPTTGNANARRMIADPGILAVVGPMNSGVMIPSSETLAPSHIAIVSPSTTNVKVTDRGLANVNRVCARDDAQGPAGADFVIETLKAKKVYVLNDKTPYGQGLADAAQKEFQAKGVQIIASEGTEEISDFSSIITKIKLAKPDAIYFGGLYPQVGPFAKQLREAGVSIPIMGGDGYDSPVLLTLAGPGAKDIYFTTIAPPLAVVPAAKAIAARFKATYKADIQGYGIMGYDSTKVVVNGILNAIKANGNKLPSRAQVEDAIRKTNLTTGTLTGPIDFNSMGDRMTAKMYVRQVNDNLQLSTAGVVNVKAPKP